jgi:hypothetical protein
MSKPPGALMLAWLVIAFWPALTMTLVQFSGVR